MSVSPDQAIARLGQKLRERSDQDVAAEDGARSLLPILVEQLREAGATRVVLFGSLVAGRFRSISDVDLAVGGITERGLAGLERELTLRANRLVELVNLDRVSNSLRDRIEKTGVDLL